MTLNPTQTSSIHEPTVGIWLYSNGGGDEIQKKLISQLKKKGIQSIPGLNLAKATAQGGDIVCNGVSMTELDLFFSYNAGGQKAFQMYLYEALNHSIPTLNNYGSFALTEDKFLTSHKLRKAGINTAEYKLVSRSDINLIKNTVREWGGQVVYKPTNGWGGNGLAKIDDERVFDIMIPFLKSMDVPHFYLEKFINYDKTDYRVDIVDGEFVGCYGRQAPKDDWKTNITGGGSIIMREPTDDIIELALKATKATGLEIAGVDLLYDRDAEEFVVLEVNGIPAFATPEQEKLGLDFNNLKIEKIANLIDKIIESNR